MGKIINIDDNRANKKFIKIPKSLLDEALSKISLVDLIGQTVALSQVSKDQWKGLCPFHNEKTPSFFVNETKNVFHCFGCGESGNAISFLMKINHIDFRQAATRILQLAGLEYYDIDDWLQSETSIIYNSIEKTVKENIDNDSIDIYLEDINKTLVYIAYTINSKVREYPELFDKMEKIYLMVDDNYRFKNYERIRDICKKLSKIIKEFSNGS